MALNAGHENGVMEGSLEDLVEATEVGRELILQSLRRLEQAGMIKITGARPWAGTAPQNGLQGEFAAVVRGTETGWR